MIYSGWVKNQDAFTVVSVDPAINTKAALPGIKSPLNIIIRQTSPIFIELLYNIQ